MKKKRRMTSRIAAIALALCVMVSMMPGAVYAGDSGLPFSLKAGGNQITKIQKETNAYSTIMAEYVGTEAEGADEWGYVYNEEKCDLYTAVISAGTDKVTLKFSEDVLVYNYTRGGEFISGEYEDSSVGVTEIEVPVDDNNDGTPDVIQVQTPYGEDGSTLLYGVTFTYAKSVEVGIVSQHDNAFLHAPAFSAVVSSDLAESYGFEDEIFDGVSALDVLCKAHELTFGDDFTKETASTYIKGSGSFVTSAFGEAKDLSFSVNDKCPNDGVWNETYGSYTGYLITQAEVKDGDFVSFFTYRDSSYLDNYGILSAEEGTYYPGQKIKVNLKGYSYCYYGCADEKTIADHTEAIEDAKLAEVNIETGELTDINGAVTDEDGNAGISFKTAGTHYVTAYVDGEDDIPLIMPLKKIEVAQPNVVFTVPADADFYVGSKKTHYVPFTEQTPVSRFDNGDGTETYMYNLGVNKSFNFRVSGEGYVTYAGIFKSPAKGKAAFEKAITESQLMPEGKTAKSIDRNLSSNGGYNMADIYLNINEKGFLNLNKGDKFQIVNLRNWESIDTLTNNYFIEPDYNYEVIDFNGNESDVVSVSASGELEVEKEGTAIVLVTYDAFTNESAVGGAGFFGATWPENTGVFVVSTEGNADIDTGMTILEGMNNEDTSAGKLSGDKIDAELDVIYYLTSLTDAEGNIEDIEEAHGEYKFTPAEGITGVEVANPVISDKLSYNGFTKVDLNEDGTYTVKLTEGRNIVKLETAKTVTYQVITAKPVTAAINNITDAGKTLKPGDQFEVTFNTLFHPANKLAGVYNMSAGILYGDVDGYEDKTLGGKAAQYNFASTPAAQKISNVVTWGTQGWSFGATLGDKLKVPADYAEETLTLSKGYLTAGGFGDPYGNHRGITYETGKAPNLNASVKVGYFGSLPDIEVKLLEKVTESIEVAEAPAKTEYFEGESFDASGLKIKINYTDRTSKYITEGFEYSKEALAAGTTVEKVTYDGNDIEIPITVNDNGIKVKLTVLGDSKHGESEEVHTYAAGNLTTWIDNADVYVEKDSYAAAAIEKGLKEAGLSFTNESGGYISEINGLSEFDNGSLSGWMYLVNDKMPSVGIDSKLIGNGDRILMFYTDDYYQEKWDFTPDVTIETGGSWKYENGAIVITPKEGYEVEEVIINGESKGSVEKVENVDIYDDVTILFKKKSHVHAWDNGTVTEKATLSSDGIITYCCTDCKAEKTEKISKAKSIKLSKTSYVYNGKAKKPVVTVTDSDGKKLVKDTDYIVKYSNNTKCGEASAKVTLKGNYSGTKTQKFKIVPKKASISKIKAGKKSISITIKSQKTSKATGYQIYYKKAGSKAKYKNVTSTKKKLTGLKKGKKYTVKVRAYKTIDGKKVYGAYSSSKHVKVK